MSIDKVNDLLNGSKIGCLVPGASSLIYKLDSFVSVTTHGTNQREGEKPRRQGVTKSFGDLEERVEHCRENEGDRLDRLSLLTLTVWV